MSVLLCVCMCACVCGVCWGVGVDGYLLRIDYENRILKAAFVSVIPTPYAARRCGLRHVRRGLVWVVAVVGATLAGGRAVWWRELVCDVVWVDLARGLVQ